jgi:hypothetical protein
MRFAAAFRDCQQEVSILANITGTFEKLGEKDSKYAKKAQQLDNELNTLYELFVAKAAEAGIQQ